MKVKIHSLTVGKEEEEMEEQQWGCRPIHFAQDLVVSQDTSLPWLSLEGAEKTGTADYLNSHSIMMPGTPANIGCCYNNGSELQCQF